MRRSAIALGFAAFALAGCSSGLPHASEAHVAALRTSDPGVSVAGLERGRTLYVERCANCHSLRDPTSLPAHAWPAEVETMRRDHSVMLEDEEARDIVRYLSAVSTVSRAE
jgi:mono/diheme cytochrome c family protein